MAPSRRKRSAGDQRPKRVSAGSSFASSTTVRARMQAQKTRDTVPEMAVRRLLHSKGYRYRVDQAPVAGLKRRADIVFAAARVAVFIDGCFWHGCEEHRPTRPRVNADYWTPKIERNISRDSETSAKFEEAGWLVIRAWEHEEPEAVVARIESALTKRLG